MRKAIGLSDVRVGPRASIFLVVLLILLGGTACAAGIWAALLKHPGVVAGDLGSHGELVRCRFQKHLAKLVALVGAGALLLGQLLAGMFGGCVCCTGLMYARGQAHRWAVILFTLSWASFFVAEACLLSAAFMNDFHTSETHFELDFDIRHCYTARPVVLWVGAAAALATTVLSVLYYGEASRSRFEAWVEQGAPTPRLYSLKSMRSFVIAGPARTGPLKAPLAGPPESVDDYQD